MQKRYLWVLAGAMALTVGLPRLGHATAPTKVVTGDTFKHEDLNAPADPGNTVIAGTGAAAKLTVTGTGNDNWAGVEQMQLAYTTLPGDGGITARLLSVSGGDSDGWAKTGTIIRDTEDPNAVHIWPTVMQPPPSWTTTVRVTGTWSPASALTTPPSPWSTPGAGATP